MSTLRNTPKLKVMTVVGTRPEIIRLSRIIDKLDKYFDHILVHTGQNYDYELNQVFFDDLGIRAPDYFLDCAGGAPAETIAQVISKSDQIFVDKSPEAILILGDTNSALSAISAKRRKIPIFHMEAGNRCFDQRVPEEINRKIIDHVADVNLPYSDIARDYLIKEGLDPSLIIKTGSPLTEVIEHNKEKIQSSKILERLDLSKQEYFVVSVHREENLDQKLPDFCLMLNALAESYKMPVIVSTHPRTRMMIDSLGFAFDDLVQLKKPFGFCDYIHLEMNASVVLSDSGTITEESSILNFPALNLRDTHERPEGMEEGAVMFTGMSVNRVMQGLNILQNQSRSQDRSLSLVSDYTALNVSEKVVRVIHSYTDYVNRVVWKKYN